MSAHAICAPIVSIDERSGEIITPTGGPNVVRAWLMGVTNALLALPKADQREFHVEHTFSDGMYMRKLFIPKGSLLVGKIHKLACMNIVAKGDISVVTESGSARITSGYTIASPPGLQKLGYAHEDTIFINVFRIDESSIDKIEQAIAWDSYEDSGLMQIMNSGGELCQ